MEVDGQPVKTALYRSYKAATLEGKPLKITNTGDAPVQAVVSVSGSPVTPEPAASNGFKIERSFFTLDGKPADISKAKRLLGYEPAFSLQKGIPELLAWVSQQSARDSTDKATKELEERNLVR